LSFWSSMVVDAVAMVSPRVLVLWKVFVSAKVRHYTEELLRQCEKTSSSRSNF